MNPRLRIRLRLGDWPLRAGGRYRLNRLLPDSSSSKCDQCHHNASQSAHSLNTQKAFLGFLPLSKCGSCVGSCEPHDVTIDAPVGRYQLNQQIMRGGAVVATRPRSTHSHLPRRSRLLISTPWKWLTCGTELN